MLDESLDFEEELDPDPRWQEHTRSVLEATVARRNVTKGRVDHIGERDSAGLGDAERKRKIAKVVQMLNGDTRKRRLVHYERVCGMCANRQDAVNNTYDLD